MPIKGLFLAISAFVIWGLFPFYFKAVAHIPALQVLSHRIIWGAIGLALLILVLAYQQRVRSILRTPKHRLLLLASSLCIACNWGVYIWSVESNRIFEASLGYYINPLVNIALGFFILGERLRKPQWVAVLLAASGVSIQVIQFGQVPWIALGLALSFGCYGLIHKVIKVESISGLFIETLLLLPLALAYLGYLASQQTGALDWSYHDWFLLSLAGPVTILPLLLYSSALKTMRYSMIGIIQYIVPSMLFLLAAFYYKEPFNTSLLLTFGLIWLALVLISIDALKQHQRR